MFYFMIRSFADATTHDIWLGTNTKAARRIPNQLWKIAHRKLDQIDRAASLEDLKLPPSNKLHSLQREQAGRYAIWINTQYRVSFAFREGDASMSAARITMTIERKPGTLPTHRAPTHPGEMLLEEFLKPLNVSQVEAAERMGVPFQRLNSVINGRRGVTADTALRFEALTGMPARFWLGLQSDYDLWHELRERNRPKIKRLELAVAR